MKITDLPRKIPVFPLSNFILLPKTSVPLNIFEPRYIDMINDAMKSDKIIGMIQPKSLKDKNEISNLYEIGCLGKITTFQETEDGRYLIELKGIIRFEKVKEIKTDNKYRVLEINYDKFTDDLDPKNEKLKFSDLEIIFKDLRSLFERKGFLINWKALEKQNLDEIINALSMASPFTLEEKQILLEAKNLDIRKKNIVEILKTYTHDIYENTTLQ